VHYTIGKEKKKNGPIQKDEFDNIHSSNMDSGDSDATEPFLKGREKKQYQRRGGFIRSPAWFVSTIILLLLLFLESIYVLVQPRVWRNTYEHGFSTELGKSYQRSFPKINEY
jgi:hypothetical protein